MKKMAINSDNLKVRVDGTLLRIARPDADKFIFLQGDPESVVGSLRLSDKRVDIFTFMQRLPGKPPQFHYYMEWDNLAAITIRSFDDWWTNQLGFKGRNKAKQAEKKGVEIREVPFTQDLTRAICDIYNECPIRQGRLFPHYGKDHATVHLEAATYLDCSVFIGAFMGNQLIGFVKVVIDPSGSQAGLMNIVSLMNQRDKAPTNALVAHAVKACAARGIPYLTYSNFSYGKKMHDSLSDFKERNGFQRLDVPRYYIPLTPLGNMALQLGLHRGFKQRIPETWAEKLRHFRQNWYNRRYASVSDAS